MITNLCKAWKHLALAQILRLRHQGTFLIVDLSAFLYPFGIGVQNGRITFSPCFKLVSHIFLLLLKKKSAFCHLDDNLNRYKFQARNYALLLSTFHRVLEAR